MCNTAVPYKNTEIMSWLTAATHIGIMSWNIVLNACFCTDTKLCISSQIITQSHCRSSFSIKILYAFSSSPTVWTSKGSEFKSRCGQEFSLLHVVQTGSGVHPSSYPIGTGGSFSGSKATGVWSWPLTSNWCRGQENVNLYIHSPIRLHGVVLN
jgi:hypothetical protein